MGVVHYGINTKEFNHKLGNSIGNKESVNNIDTDFHLYTLEWFPDKLIYYIDNKELLTIDRLDYVELNSNWVFDQRFHLIINLAIGGNWGGIEGVDNNIFPQELIIDYIKVYELKYLN